MNKEKLVLLNFYLEYKDKDWLREQALKKSMTMGALIRYYIRYFRKNKSCNSRKYNKAIRF